MTYKADKKWKIPTNWTELVYKSKLNYIKVKTIKLYGQYQLYKFAKKKQNYYLIPPEKGRIITKYNEDTGIKMQIKSIESKNNCTWKDWHFKIPFI